MTTIRVARRDRFVVIDQATVRDRKLSLRARGLLVTLLSYPDNWRINSTEVARHVKEGRDAIRACLAELEDAGYLSRNRCRIDTATKKGVWITELVLRETPGRSDDGFPGVGFPGVGKPGANRKTVTKDCEEENSATRSTGAVDNSEISEDDLKAIKSPKIRAIIEARTGRGG